ncbi:hypothetical protein J6R97_06985 [bacterium]|jgi:hypothetical protein|nr:hypothetical protein [bacterium]
MKKILFLISIFLITNPVFAKNIKVQAIDDFSTVKPPKTWKIKVLETFITDNGIVIHQNTIINGNIENVKSPQRLKRNATFIFIPKTYQDPQIGYKKNIKRDFQGKYNFRSDLSAKDVAKKGALTAGNMLVGAFVAPTVGLVEGAVKNEEGNRVKSAVVSAYENTPLSYANKGKDIELKSGQVFIMNFKLKEDDAENLPNYSYEIAE